MLVLTLHLYIIIKNNRFISSNPFPHCLNWTKKILTYQPELFSSSPMEHFIFASRPKLNNYKKVFWPCCFFINFFFHLFRNDSLNSNGFSTVYVLYHLKVNVRGQSQLNLFLLTGDHWSRVLTHWQPLYSLCASFVATLSP